ncbi:MAG: BON domain-containing protein [Candidatus Eremiobacteraeota bacterium]|nr:BON domain-containing protein [Candidatus Eremiobacteraeota bacterium]
MSRTVLATALAALALAGCTGTGSNDTKAPEPFGTRAATAVLKDALLTSAVKATITTEDPDSVATVGVSARDGVVTLHGRVRDATTKTKLVAAARKTGGVKSVVDELIVDSRTPKLREQAGDVALATRVQAAITAQLGFQHVTVTVNDAVATLDGTVPDAKTKATVLATARGTTGIRNVVDKVRVERS